MNKLFIIVAFILIAGGTLGATEENRANRKRKTTDMMPCSTQQIEELINYDAKEAREAARKACSMRLRKATHTQLTTECAMCLQQLRDNKEGRGYIAKLYGCKHMFHIGCLQEMLQANTCYYACPMCDVPLCDAVRTKIPKPGLMPSGTMQVKQYQAKLPGFKTNSRGTIKIVYKIKAGIQESYHKNPGTPYKSDERSAYLPDNEEGRDLLKRLKFAFRYGLTLSIGFSHSRDVDNVVIWIIPHKSNPKPAGDYGFPDPNYFKECNESLDQLGVPDADNL